MKNILFASTALIATAGVAAADISFSGYGRFGLIYDEGADKETSLEQRFRLTVNANTETDNGVKFEGFFRFQTDDSGNKASGFGPGAAGFSVSTSGFRMDFGHVSDVVDAGDVLDFFGYSIGLSEFYEMDNPFSGVDAEGFGADNDVQQRVSAHYSTDSGVTVAATYAPQTNVYDEYWQIGGAYAFGDHQVGVIYGDNQGSGDYWVLGANGGFGEVGYAAVVGDSDVQDDVAWSLSGEYAVSTATAIQGMVSGGGVDSNDTAYGIGFHHGLGGGVRLMGGVAQVSSGDTVADLGVWFDF